MITIEEIKDRCDAELEGRFRTDFERRGAKALKLAIEALEEYRAEPVRSNVCDLASETLEEIQKAFEP